MSKERRRKQGPDAEKEWVGKKLTSFLKKLEDFVTFLKEVDKSET